jgi:hypothetical protein
MSESPVPTPAETPAALLHRAAEKMRALAQAATDGPWRTHDTYVPAGGYTATVLVGVGNDVKPVAWMPSFSNDPNEIGRQAYPNAAYAAAMHPGVALLIAAWLESWAGIDISEHGPHSDDWAHALRIARAYLREVS